MGGKRAAGSLDAGTTKKTKKTAAGSRDLLVRESRKPAGPLDAVVRLKAALRARDGGDPCDGGTMGLANLVDNEGETKRIKKDMKDDEELNEEEQDIVKKRMLMMQQRMQEFERREKQRKYGEVRAVAGPMVTNEEIDEALEAANGNEGEAAMKLCDRRFLMQVRRELARECTYEQRQQERQKSGQLGAGQKMKTRRINSVKAISASFHKDGRQYERNRLDLDEAIASGPNDEWSPARIRAWNLMDENPNAYYYRFNAPGEKQKRGGTNWSEEDHKLFMEIYHRQGGPRPNMKWGLFSMYIPGRVGYQCSAYYRKLIEKGVITDDPYYFFDENGKLKFSRQGNPNGSSGVPAAKPIKPVAAAKPPKAPRAPKAAKPASGKKGKRKRARGGDDNIYANDLSDEDDDNFDETAYNYKKKYVSSFRSGRRNRGEEVEENPLPGFLCPITYEEVEAPAISPYGYVAGYQQWANCLNNGRCPFTKKPLKLEDVVLLTKDNIDAYREKIVNG